MNFKIYAVNLFIPLLVILIIAAISGCFRLKKKESIKGDLFEFFKQDWEADETEPVTGEKESFFQRFFKLLVQTYEYEQYKESVNRSKYNFYKLLVLFVVLSIPFLCLFLITSKEWVLNNSDWNDIYLYTVILVPLIFAYLVNKYIRLRQYHETWYRHLKVRHEMEWRMMVFVKDYELLKSGAAKENPDVTVNSLKIDFINDMCALWKDETTGIANSPGAKDENIFEEIGALFKK